jgi:hypothetical protein
MTDIAKEIQEDYELMYKILKAIYRAGTTDFSMENFSAGLFSAPRKKFETIITLLSEENFIRGLKITETVAGKNYDYSDVSLTLDGIRFLIADEFEMKACFDDAEKGIVQTTKFN